MPVHRFKRTTSYSVTLFDAGGWGASPGFGSDLSFTFSLQKVYIYLGGISTWTANVPNYTEFTNLFNEWKINSVKVTFYYSNNNSSLNTPTTALPLINVVFDPTSAAALGLAGAQQFPGVKTFQLGNGAYGPPSFLVKPKPLALQYNGVTSAYAQSSDLWISSQYPETQHYALKVVYDPTVAPGTSTLIGNVNFYFEFDLSFRSID